MRGATRSRARPCRLQKDFNPRTPCGVRPAVRSISMQDVNHFNPRTPCGVRPGKCCETRREKEISIHAPRAGCDPQARQRCSSDPISIHAPRAGCDVLPRQDSKLSQISIHAPRAGCDHQTASKGHSEAISIHAPRAGCDLGRKACPARTVHFNPRTPCGVRQPRAPATGATYLFQSTHPVRGATPDGDKIRAGKGDFNPRTPCGVRRGRRLMSCATTYFNPRTPCGVRPKWFL